MKSLCLLLSCLLVLNTFAEELRWVDDAAIQHAKQALVNVQVETTTSMFGFFVSEDGLIVTPASPLEDAKQVIVTTSAHETIRDCHLVAIDLVRDIAILATGRKAPAHLVVSPDPAVVGDTCAVVFGFSPGQEVKGVDGKLLARHEGLNHKQRHFIDYWIAARSPSGSGLLGGAVITRDGWLAGMCLRQEIDQGPDAQERVLIVPETSIAPLLAAARETDKPLMFPQTDKTSDEGIAAVDPDANAGALSAMSGDLNAAIKKYRIALQRLPHNTVVMYGLAQSLLAESNFGKAQTAEARRLLENASSADPKHLRVRLLLGQVLGRMGEIKEAIVYLENLTREFPKLAEAWAVLADTLQHEGRKTEAAAAMKQGTELEPESLNVWNMYAAILAEIGDFDAASKARDRVHELESLFFKLKYSAPHRK